jgi:hypothetical protein
LERQKEGSKSFIIPNIRSIAKLFEEKHISKTLDQRDFFKGIGYENEDYTNTSSYVVEGTATGDGKTINEMFLTGEARKHRLHAVTYYYKNGRPIFDEFKSSSFTDTYAKDPAPFYEGSMYNSTFLPSIVRRNVKTEKNLGSNSILNSDPWNIRLLYPEDKEKKLREEIIQQLLSIGKAIASYDEVAPFKIIVEYNGKSDNHSEDVNY